VRLPKHGHRVRWQITHGDESGADRVVYIVIDIRDSIGETHDLAFERDRPARAAVCQHARAWFRVVEDAVAHFFGEI
jgi:hypothetical protein